jgi:beta-xylosidase
VGYRQNDPYTSYLEMKPEDSLSREEIAMLDRESQGDPVRDEILEIGTEWEITLPMLENDVHLLELEPIK